MSGARIDAEAFRGFERDVGELSELAMGSFARAFSLIRAEKQRRIRVAVVEAAQAYTGPDGLAIPVAFLVAAATKP
jgi:hypothetical protein